MGKQYVQQPFEKEYDVQRILAERKERSKELYQKDKTFYLVKWKGYSYDQNTWEPYCHLKNVPQKIRQWKNRRNKQISTKQAKIRPNQLQDALLSSNAGLITKLIDKTNNKMSSAYPLSGSKKEAGSKQAEATVRFGEKNWEQSDQQIQNEETTNNSQKGLNQKLKPTKYNREKVIFNEMKPLKPQKIATPLNPQESKLKKSRPINRSSNFKDTSSRLKEKGRLNTKEQKLNKQPIFIQISDSSSQQSSEDMSQISVQEEIIIEQSVSYSQESVQAAANIDPPQFFLNIEIQKTDMLQQLQRQHFFKAEAYVTKMNSQKECFMEQLNAQLCFHEPEQLQNECLQNQIQQISFNYSVLGNQRKQNEINYENLYQIVLIYKENEVLYCTLTDKNGLTVQKVTQQSIQAIRPDLITSFLNGRFPK